MRPCVIIYTSPDNTLCNVDESTFAPDSTMPTRLPANPAAYTGLRHSVGVSGQRPEAHDRRHPSARIGVLTGEFGAKVITPLIDRLGRDDVRVVPVVNEFFGGNTAVTGLMTGADLTRVLADQPAGDRYLLPDVCLSDDGRFLDGVTVAELPQPVEIVAPASTSLVISGDRTLWNPDWGYLTDLGNFAYLATPAARAEE